MTSPFFGDQPGSTIPDPPAGGSTGPAQRPTEHGRRRRRPYILLLVALLAATGLGQTPPGRNFLRSAGVTGPTGHYSELAFSTPGDLARELYPGDALPALPFLVRNATGATRTYHWTVELTGSGAPRQVAAGQATLLDGGGITITPQGRVACTTGPVRVTVRLDQHRSIGYDAACVSGNMGRQE